VRRIRVTTAGGDADVPAPPAAVPTAVPVSVEVPPVSVAEVRVDSEPSGAPTVESIGEAAQSAAAASEGDDKK
jgi:hypothetical protein